MAFKEEGFKPKIFKSDKRMLSDMDGQPTQKQRAIGDGLN